jgi:rSAM/selenodomain-associated transferase 2/rSAM/selenodomain-associated transferase 1
MDTQQSTATRPAAPADAGTPSVSIIIPVWRDEAALAAALDALHGASGVEIIVVTALGDEPRYRDILEPHAAVRWVSAPRGRAAQMNAGAATAGGRWLLFLHADSTLPSGWRRAIERAERHERVVAGAFRLALATADWRARVVEFGVRLRVALLRLPYGDQALFVRRGTFEALGGYRDLPLMEDVDLVRRLKHAGRFWFDHLRVLTSPRRWERDGWFRRSAQNARLATRFLFGASPARLAQRYFGRHAAAVVMMGRAPWAPGKTRLCAGLDPAAHTELRRAILLDTFDVLATVRSAARVVACEPADACERMRELLGPSPDVIAQRGDDLGQRLRHVVEDVFRLGSESVVVIGSDLPDLPARLLGDALEALRGGGDRVILGPAGDGGYYLIGMNRPHPELFERIAWGTDQVLAQTLAAAQRERQEVQLLEPWRDLDTADDLARVTRSGDAAPRTRAWVRRHDPESGGDKNTPVGDGPAASR